MKTFSFGRTRLLIPLLLLIAITIGSQAVGSDGSRSIGSVIPLELQVHIFLKIMTYDRALIKDSTLPYLVGVLEIGRPSPPGGSGKIQDALRRKTMMGRPIECLLFTGIDQLIAAKSPLPDLLVIIGEDEVIWPALEQVIRERRLMTFGTSPNHLPHGVGIALTLEGDNPVIWLNLDVTREAGADFHANFLKHCRIRK